MGYISTTRLDTSSIGARTFTADGGTIIGVELATSIPQSYPDDPDNSGEFLESDGRVKIRPTNVTATIGNAAGEDPSIILLHNGVNGGFRQEMKLPATGTFRVNAVVTGVLTDS